MIEIKAQFYLYALYVLMICTTISFIFVIQSLKSTKISIKSIQLFNIYFILGIIGWLTLGINGATQISIHVKYNIAFYILASFILLLAVAECSRNNRSITIIGLLHCLLILFSFFINDVTLLMLYLSVYAALTYSLISFIAIKRAYKNQNIGDALIGFVTFFIILLSLCQIYILIVLKDVNLIYGIALIGNSTSFVMVGIGFLTSILIAKLKQLKLLTLKDPLTGLLNRRGMEYTLKVSQNSTSNFNNCISVIAIDIDHFKKINDSYGHEGGDKVLQEIGKVLLKFTRSQDVCCRLGGEEFVIVQPDTSIDIAINVAERIRAHIQNLALPYEDQLIKLTSSFGVASGCTETDIDLLLKNADKALYNAKYEGRNRVTKYC